jgi:N-acetylglucosaminyldiphosphoundecaprenol N-acetyl-beta-D-mannosaminyltransferase
MGGLSLVRAFTLRVDNCEVTVNVTDMTELLREIHSRFTRGLGFAVATVNLDHLVKLKRNAAFRTAYQRHDLVVADGNPIVWLSRLAGTPVSLVPGADLVEPLASLAARDNVAVALIGSTAEILGIAADRLKAAHPGLRIVACLSPGQGFKASSLEATGIIEQLRASGAQFAFLALGAPRQEMFAARCREELPEMGFVSIGAGLDFIAASQHRAPLWLRRLAMEWAWRTLTNPRRLARRYARCAMSFPHFVMNTLRRSSP